VLDVLVAEIMLQGSGMVPVVGKFIAARMPQLPWGRVGRMSTYSKYRTAIRLVAIE
jgi:hypothetical protein